MNDKKLLRGRSQTIVGEVSIPKSVVAIRLCRCNNKSLYLSEEVGFSNGSLGIDTVLRRAAVSGHVEVGGLLGAYFSDLLDKEGDIVETVALDRGSYGALKNKWMKCKMLKD